MRRTNLEAAGDVLKRMLQETTIGSSMSQQEAVSLWPKVAGEAIARFTKNVSIYEGTLFVQLKSSIAGEEIRIRQQELIDKMNVAIGMKVVKEIRTR